MAKEVEALTILLAARTAEFERAMAAGERRIDKIEKKARGSTALIERDFARMSQRVKSSMDQVGRSFNLSGVAIGGIGAAALAREAVQYADAWTTAGNSLRTAGVAASRQKPVLDALFASAQRNSTAFGALTDVFGKASLNAAELGADEAKLIKFTDGVAVAVKAAGKSTSESSGALLQLGQLLGAGTVRAEEFNSVLEGAPTILTAVAAGMDGTGGSVAKLRAMVLAGEVSSKQFFDAFLKGKPVIDDMAARALPTVGNAITRINNALTKYVGENAATEGAVKALIGGLNTLADNFETTADVALKFAGIIAAALLGRAIGGMIATLGSGAAALGGFVKALAEVRTAGGIAGLTSAAGGLGAALGPIGALLGVAAAAGLYFAQQSNQAAEAADRARAAIDQMGATAEGRTEAIRKLADELKRVGETELRGQAADNSALITQQAKSLRGFQVVGQNLKIEGLSKTIAKLLNDNDIGAYNKALVAIGKQYPQHAQLLRNAAKAGDEYSSAIDKQITTLEEIEVRGEGPTRRGPSRIQGEAYRGEAERAAPGGFTPGVAQIERDALAEAAKSDREKAIDEQTDKLVKQYESTGQKITDAIRDALRQVATQLVNTQADAKETAKRIEGGPVGAAMKLIAEHESFRSAPYIDWSKDAAGNRVNTGLAIGYGTHYFNGRKVQEGDRVTRDEADAELQQRVEGYYARLRDRLGATFDSLGDAQKAVLASLEHNYGTAPARVTDLIRAGATTENVAAAIRNLGSDNAGVNRNRRAEEAETYAGGVTAAQKITDKRVENERDFERDAKRKREDLELDLRRAEAKEGFNFALEKEARLLQLKREAQDEGRALDEAELERLDARAQKETELAQKVEEAEQRKKDAKQRTADAEKAIGDAQQFFAEGATDAFTDIVTGAATAEQALRKLLQAFVEAAIKATLLGQGPLAGLFGTAGKDGGLGGIFGMLFGGLGGGKASGGRVSRGQVYPVGENGREMFAPGESGRIIPNSALNPRIVVARSAGPARISPQVNMKIDLRGANGDETIRRIASDAASRAGQEAYRQARRDSGRDTEVNRQFVTRTGMAPA